MVCQQSLLSATSQCWMISSSLQVFSKFTKQIDKTSWDLPSNGVPLCFPIKHNFLIKNNDVSHRVVWLTCCLVDAHFLLIFGWCLFPLLHILQPQAYSEWYTWGYSDFKCVVFYLFLVKVSHFSSANIALDVFDLAVVSPLTCCIATNFL